MTGLKNMIVAIRWRILERKSFFKSKRPSITEFYIIIPALREQNVIIRTLDRLSNLRYPKNKYSIIIALDSKEQSDINGIKTKDIVIKYITQNPKLNINFVEYFGPEQKRATQINVAYKYIQNDINTKKKDAKNSFIGIYDADSYPDLNVLSYINYKYLENTKSNLAFQQTINYLFNSETLKKKNALLLSNAYYQTIWGYSFELEQYFKTNKKIEQNRTSLLPPYCMGHGEYFHYDVLKTTDGFPLDGPADGIQIGYILTEKKIKILPVPFDDFCESPEDLKVLFRQHTFWFCGNMYYFKTIKTYKLLSFNFVQTVNKLFIGLKWLFRPYFVIVAFILTINSILFWVLLFLIFGYFIIGYLLLLKYVVCDSERNIKKLKFFGFELPFSDLYLSFGGLNGFQKLMRHFLFGIKLKFSKVER